MRRFAPLVITITLLSGCAIYFDDEGDPGAPGDPNGPGSADAGPTPVPTTFTLKKTSAIAGELPVVGIDTDRAGGVWVAYRLQLGDYYAPADVRVVHLDASGQKLVEFRYDDEYTTISGLAYSGDAIWLNYNTMGGTGNNHIRKLDPVTGERLGSIATEIGIVDLDVRGDDLLLSNLWNQVIALDRETGGEKWRVPVAGFLDSTQRGLASTDEGRRWISSAATNQIMLYDAGQHLLGAGVTSLLDPSWNGGEGLHLAWDGRQLLLSARGQIYWLSPQGAP